MVRERVKGPRMTMSSQRNELTSMELRELWGNTRIASGSSSSQFIDAKSSPQGMCIHRSGGEAERLIRLGFLPGGPAE